MLLHPPFMRVLLILFLAALASCSRSSLPQYFLENAQKAIQDGRHEDAHRYLDRGIKLSPGNAELLALQGWLFYREAAYSKASDAFSRAAAAAPGQSVHLEGRVWAEMCQGRYKEASELSKLSYQNLNWHSEEALWSCLASYLSNRSLKQDAEAKAVLEAAKINSKWTDWPKPVFEYLREDISRIDFLRAASTLTQETEARTYLGFDALFKGKTGEAIHEFKWVKEKGSEEVFERNLAIAELERLSKTNSSPPIR